MIKSKCYELQTGDGYWLGQAVLTEDGLFASVTDYGNLSYSWRAFGKRDFREFICDLNNGYFATKLATGMGYIAASKKIDVACARFADKILPALQAVLREDLKNNPTW